MCNVLFWRDANTFAMQTSHASKPAMHAPFGNLVAFGDPLWYQGWHTPYYNESHVKLRQFVRSWVDEHITPFCHEWFVVNSAIELAMRFA